MVAHDIVVVGASAGGVEALRTFVAGLPAQLPAAVFVVLHIPADARSSLARILDRAGPLPARTAQDGDAIELSRILVASPDRHLLLTPDGVRVVHGPQENGSRPAIDPLFRTAALAFGPRVVGVILSGMLNDGTAGLIAIKRQGGLALVQDPATAFFAGMPKSACNYVAVDYCLPVQELSKVVALQAKTEVSEPVGHHESDEMQLEANIAGLDPFVLEQGMRPGTISSLTCPTCKGPIWEIQDGPLLRFRCRVGHAFTVDSMTQERAMSVENSLWMVMNSLEENVLLYQRLAQAAHAQQDEPSLQELHRNIRTFQKRIHTIRQMLEPGEAAAE